MFQRPTYGFCCDWAERPAKATTSTDRVTATRIGATSRLAFYSMPCPAEFGALCLVTLFRHGEGSHENKETRQAGFRQAGVGYVWRRRARRTAGRFVRARGCPRHQALRPVIRESICRRPAVSPAARRGVRERGRARRDAHRRRVHGDQAAI